METVHYILIGVILFFLLTSYNTSSTDINKKTMEAYSPLPRALNFKGNKFINFMQPSTLHAPLARAR